MDLQMVFNAVLGLAAFLCGYVLKSINASINSLQQADITLSEKVQKIEVLVAGDYVKNDHMQAMMSALFAKLDKISDKIDTKADKL